MHEAWTPPHEIDQFRVERLLGHGATADVWLAHDTLLDRTVALKIASVPASAETRTRFRVEARAIARMQHPNLLAIHHVGEVGERPFLVTECLDGRSLDALPLPLPADRVVGIGIDLARGLAGVHRAGVLHRDIKPANAFLGEDGVARLLDFGLAKLADAGASLDETSPRLHANFVSGELAATDVGTTIAGRLMGTPLYMAPETWRGESATRRTDVYSLGALLFELATGRPPCGGASFIELRARALEGRIDDLAALAPSAPEPLVEIIERCLALSSRQRPTADELCDALARLQPAPPSERAEAHLDLRDNPYRGLRVFGPEHRALFFGREAETARVTAELRANPFVLVTGASGAGKSSLVRAGVAPRVEKEGISAGAGWQVAVLVPGRRPLDALAIAVAPALGIDDSTCLASLRRSRDWLAGELRARRARLLLVIDQLEEAWTLSPPSEREWFFGVLSALAGSARTVRAVATLRADFLGHMEDMGELQAHALRALVVLPPMSPDGVRRAIVEPARRRGVTIEPALVERLVRAYGNGSLPLLEFALGELYARCDRARASLGAADLDALGGVEGALSTHADETLARLPTEHQREARRILLALVTIEGTRARAGERDLLGEGSPAAHGALGALVDARLVVASAGEHGASYEVAHEALLSGWPALRGWLAEERATREAKERARRAAAEWERLGHPDEALFSERQLREVDVLTGDAIDRVSAAFLDASRASTLKARLRRSALRVGAPIAAGMMLAATAAGVRWNEWRQARAFVDARLAEAAPLTRARFVLDEAVDAARRDAFARFDQDDGKGGEARWRDALALVRRESDAFAAASAPLDLALARDPQDPAARARAADLAYARLLAAERDHEPEIARDVASRLAVLDDDGSRRARLEAPAHLHVSTLPAGARVVLHRVKVEADGRWGEDEGLPVDPRQPLVLPPGSYVLTASAPGRATTRLPLSPSRAEEAQVVIPLLAEAALPPGFVFVPGGTSLFGSADVEGVRNALDAAPEHSVAVAPFLIDAHEVTFAAYLDFLRSLPPAERAARRPHATDIDLVFDADGAPSLTLGQATAAEGTPLCRPARAARRCQDWLRFPVAGIAWEDAQAYAAWLAREKVPGARLCSEREWERAARGADGRLYAHGDALHGGEADFDATYGNDPDQMGLDEVGSFPSDRSPFGALDLNGNVAEWVGLDAATRVARGGRWRYDAFNARSAYRFVRHDARNGTIGLRVCADAPSLR